MKNIPQNNSNEKSSSEEDSRTVSIYIHPLHDDYELSLIEFRLVCRIARRGVLTESIKELAANLCLSSSTIKRGLKVLVNAGVVKRESKPGHSSAYTLLPYSNWIPKEHLQAIRVRVFHPFINTINMRLRADRKTLKNRSKKKALNIIRWEGVQ